MSAIARRAADGTLRAGLGWVGYHFAGSQRKIRERSSLVTSEYLVYGCFKIRQVPLPKKRTLGAPEDGSNGRLGTRVRTVSAVRGD